MALQEVCIQLEVPPGYREGGRLDAYLARFLSPTSRTKIQQGIREGRVTVNGVVVQKPAYTVQAGDVITLRLLRRPPVELRPEPIPLEIVYEDPYLLVINKQAGLVVHPARGNRSGTLVNALLHHIGSGPVRFEEEDELPDDEAVGLSMVSTGPTEARLEAPRPGIVHRLDKDTTGLIVVAKDDETHVGLARQFEQRTIARTYLALVWGIPNPLQGRIEAPIGRDPRDRQRMAVVPEDKGKRAVTHYEVIEVLPATALVQFRLETGRTHQIRVHAQHIRHPVLGDPAYGGRAIRYGLVTPARKAFYEQLFARLMRQALHAHTLGFRHPRTGEWLHFSVPLPEDMAWALEKLRNDPV